MLRVEGGKEPVLETCLILGWPKSLFSFSVNCYRKLQMKLLDNPIFRYHIRTCLCFVHHCVPSQVSFWAHSWCSLNMC